MTGSSAERQRTCIYCRRETTVAAFNREHVLQRAWTPFDHGMVIDCVCAVCNQSFGDGIDRVLARDSAEGHLRYDHGVTEIRPASRKSGVSIAVDAGPCRGAPVRLTKAADGSIGFESLPRIGFARESEGPYEYFAVDTVPDRAGLVDRFGLRCCFVAPGVPRDVVERTLAARGYQIGQVEEVPAPQTATLVAPKGREQNRAVAKVAFNYLAYVAGRRTPLMANFDDIRDYIVKGDNQFGGNVVMAQQVIDLLDDRGQTRRGHFVTLQSSTTGLVAQVSLFSEVRYLVQLARVPLLTMGFDAGHFFDLDARCVVPMKPPPFDGAFRTAPHGVSVQLGRRRR
jgi:hypothetical protein